MHQSRQRFAANDISNHVSVLFSAGNDFLKYFHFTIPFDLGIDLQVPDDSFAVVWPACSDVRLFVQICCDDDCDWSEFKCLKCRYEEMITLVPKTKFKILLQDQRPKRRHNEAELNSSPGSCRLMYIQKEYLESQQRKMYTAEFAIPQHVTKLEQTIISNLSAIEKEKRMQAPGFSDVITNQLDTCAAKLLRTYSRQFPIYKAIIAEPVRDTLAARLPELQNYIRAHGHEYMTVSQLAEQFNVHRCSLSKCFKKHNKVTLHDYLQNIRVKQIEHMLKDEDIPIRSIAKTFGYKRISSFSKFFRMMTGTTPTQHRRGMVNQKTLGKKLDNPQVRLYDHKNIQE